MGLEIKGNNPLEGKQVVVVEDNLDIAELVVAILRIEGCRVTVYGDPNEALSNSTETPPDLIVTDQMLPGMTGIEYLKELNKRGITTPAMVISALSRDIIERSRGNSNIEFGYIEKPFEIPDLIDKAKSLLSRNGQS